MATKTHSEKEETIVRVAHEAEALAERITKLDEVAAKYAGAITARKGPFTSTMILAQAMGELRELLTPEVMAPILRLQNSPLGFLTDRMGKAKDGKPKDPYPLEIVRDCVIEAALRGFAVCGNEWNIIASRWYGAKAGFERLVRTFPGLSNYRDGFSVPRIAANQNGAVVTCWAEWELHKKPARIEREFAVKGDSYATADSYLGKASRKLAAAVYARLTGISTPEGEIGEGEITPAATEKGSAAMPALEEKQKSPREKQNEAYARENYADAIRTSLDNLKMSETDFIGRLLELEIIKEPVFGVIDLDFPVLKKCIENWTEIIAAIRKLEEIEAR